MPTVLNIDGYRFYFFSDEGNEPCHIHVKMGDGRGKVWLLPNIEDDYYYGFTEKGKRKIKKIVNENYVYLVKKWDEYFKR